jgi:hypothetical protein
MIVAMAPLLLVLGGNPLILGDESLVMFTFQRSETGSLPTPAAPIRLLGSLAPEVHEAPCDEEEDHGVEYETAGGCTPRGAGDPRAKDAACELVHFGVGHNEEDERRDDGDDKLVLLLAPAASTATIFKQAHL